MTRIKTLILTAAILTVALVSSASGSTASTRTVTVTEASGVVTVTIRPGDSFRLLSRGDVLRVHRANGSVVVVGITGFRSLSVSAAS